jgi:hypothetical protein
MKIITKNYQRLAFVLIAAVVFLSSICCKKNIDRHTYAPISIMFILNYDLRAHYDTGTTSMEMGYLFSVARKGKIASLGAVMSKEGTYKVTLWDAASQTPLARATVTQSYNGEHQFSPINSVPVTPGISYLVSITARPADAHAFETIDGGAMHYPLTYGSVSILGYRVKQNPGNAATFPTTEISNYAEGFPDVAFDAD